MERLEQILHGLTLEEKVALCRGSDAWHTNAVERLGVPRLKVTDGPNGARGASFSGAPSACFPCGTALAATWDVALVREIGEAIGLQARSKNAGVLLGPTMNIHRTPLAGRNFECYSEDPHLSARMAVAYIQGVRSTGVAACAKHFVANDSEYERHSISSVVDERTLREISLVPFEAAVREAGAEWVMAAYNKLNGDYCAEHAWLLQDLLRDEWGFQGVVVSDWWGAQSCVGSANGGLDLEMPGPGQHYMQLAEAVQNGEVDEAVVDAKVSRVLATIRDTQDIDPTLAEQSLDRPEDRALIRRAGAESIVLLRNDGVLPLDPARSIAVIGPNAWTARIGGGGSAEVNALYAVSPLEGIRAAADDVRFVQGCAAHSILPELRGLTTKEQPGMQIELFENTELSGQPVRTEVVTRARFRWLLESPVDSSRFSFRLTGVLDPEESGTWTFSLISAGVSRLFVDDELVVDNWTHQEPGPYFFGTGSKEVAGTTDLEAGVPVTVRVEFASRHRVSALHVGCLPPLASDELTRAAALAAECDAAVVVVGADGEWETEGRDREHMGLPGPQDDLVRAVAGAQPNTVVVVNTGAPYAMPWADDVPALLQCWYAGQELGNALADVLFGKTNPSGKLPTTFPMRYEDHPGVDNYPGSDGEVRYEEGVLVGYRHYDAAGVEPRFCFGHGLSYTTFDYGDLRVEGDAPELRVSVDVTNTGEIAGAEVVQLYVSDPESSVPRPPQELKAFSKVRLEPGRTQTVTFTLDERAFSFWGPGGSTWGPGGSTPVLRRANPWSRRGPGGSTPVLRRANPWSKRGPDGWTLEPGDFVLGCGSSSRDIRATARVAITEPVITGR